MTVVFKNGMPCVPASKTREGYRAHKDISAKIGVNLPRLLKIPVKSTVEAGVYTPFNVQLKELHFVKLNNQKLKPKIDYIVEDNSRIAFTFSIYKTDKIEIKGVV